MVGHSMGGLVAKLTATHSDDRLWYAIANRPLSEINISEEGRQRLADWFYFEPLPFVRRVVFMGTPHGGAMAASQTVGRCGSRFVEYPTAQIIEHDLLVKQNPGVFSPEVRDRVPTSIDMMESSSCLLKAVKELCPGANVQLHNIIGTKCLSPLEGCGDGVVSVKDAKHPGVSTEKTVHSSHVGLHSNEDALKELMCILRRHILEANDEPGVADSECVTPDSVMPEQVEPCPPEALTDECWEGVEMADPVRHELQSVPADRRRGDSAEDGSGYGGPGRRRLASVLRRGTPAGRPGTGIPERLVARVTCRCSRCPETPWPREYALRSGEPQGSRRCVAPCQGGQVQGRMPWMNTTSRCQETTES